MPNTIIVGDGKFYFRLLLEIFTVRSQNGRQKNGRQLLLLRESATILKARVSLRRRSCLNWDTTS